MPRRNFSFGGVFNSAKFFIRKEESLRSPRSNDLTMGWRLLCHRIDYHIGVNR